MKENPKLWNSDLGEREGRGIRRDWGNLEAFLEEAGLAGCKREKK